MWQGSVDSINITSKESEDMRSVTEVRALAGKGLEGDRYFEHEKADSEVTLIEAEARSSLYTRLAAWEINWLITSKHLLFGTGPGGYAAYLMSYFPTRAMATHSNYLDILAQTGIIGSVLFLWFLISLVRMAYRLYRRVRGRGDFLEALANAAFAGTIGSIVIMGFGDWILPFAYTQTIAGYDHAVYSWLFMGTIPVLDRLSIQGQIVET